MEILNFIAQYWDKLAVVIAAIGYVLKVILDFRYKKKEISFNLNAAEQLKAVLSFFNQYNKMQMQITYFLGTKKDQQNTQDEYLRLKESMKQYIDTALSASFFFNKQSEEQSYVILRNIQSTVDDIKKVRDNFADVIQYSVTLTDTVENFKARTDQNQRALNAIKKQFKN